MEIKESDFPELKIKDIEIPSIIEDYDPEEYKEMIFLLTEMIFSAPYERYAINILNKIIKLNYGEIENLFKISDYTINDIICQFKEILNNQKKKKKNDINISLDAVGEQEVQKENMNIIDKSQDNQKGNKISKNISSTKSYLSSIFKTNLNINSIFSLNETKEKEINNILSIIEEQKEKKNKKDLKDFLDTFNFNGDEYELFVQNLLFQIFKCLEKKDNSFKFLCNQTYGKINKIFENLKVLEFDFLIKNVDKELFKSVLFYLKNNILLLSINGKKYEIKGENNLEQILIFNSENLDILGEIGLNSFKDQHKIAQFNKYSNLLKKLNNSNEDINAKNKFYNMTELNENNHKIIFFITDSNFDHIYKGMKDSDLYKEMMKSEGVDYILCYLSKGLNEQIIISNYLIENNNQNNTDYNNQDNKDNHNQNNTGNNKSNNKDNKFNNDILKKLKISQKEYIKSEKFKKTCYKLNNLINDINSISKIYYNNSENDLIYLSDKFIDLITEIDMELIGRITTFLNDNKIKDFPITEKQNEKYQYSIIYLKSKIKNDEIPEIKNSYILNLDENEENLKKIVAKIKDNHKINVIYFFVCDYTLLEEELIENFVNETIKNLNIPKTHYLFLCNKTDNNISNFKRTLSNHIIIVENNLGEKLNHVRNEINSYYEGLCKIFEEKNIYDKLIKAFFKVTYLKIKKSSNEDEKDLISKINEALIFMSKLNIDKSNDNKENQIITEENREIKLIFENIDKSINSNVDKVYENQIEIISKEIKNLFQNQENVNHFFELAKKNVNDFCKKCLKRCIFNYIYTYFINIITPKISFDIWNKEIEKFLSKKK